MPKTAKISEDLFDRYAFWRVLSRLASDNPNKGHVQEIARKTGLSAGMASRVLRQLEKLGIVSKQANGNQHVYSLEPTYFTTEIKRLVFLAQIHDAGFIEKMLERHPGILSIALYGSRVKGDSIARSDVDLIVIASPGGRMDLSDLGQEIELDINAQIFTPGQFLKLKIKDKTFYEEIMRNHIILYGSGLP
jgi:predicted nucleotidyltransferase